jgi:hypothetical protein
LEISVSFLEIHKWELDICIGFPPAFHLQCRVCNYIERTGIKKKNYSKFFFKRLFLAVLIVIYRMARMQIG